MEVVQREQGDKNKVFSQDPRARNEEKHTIRQIVRPTHAQYSRWPSVTYPSGVVFVDEYAIIFQKSRTIERTEGSRSSIPVTTIL